MTTGDVLFAWQVQEPTGLCSIVGAHIGPCTEKGFMPLIHRHALQIACRATDLIASDLRSEIVWLPVPNEVVDLYERIEQVRQEVESQ